MGLGLLLKRFERCRAVYERNRAPPTPLTHARGWRREAGAGCRQGSAMRSFACLTPPAACRAMSTSDLCSMRRGQQLRLPVSESLRPVAAAERELRLPGPTVSGERWSIAKFHQI